MDISFILVEPKVPENLGAAARAIKTMGFKKLYLVNPCEYKTGKAKWLAHGSANILDDAKVFTNLEEAINTNELAIGTTGRHRTLKNEYIDLKQLTPFLESRGHVYSKIALVFGREESGLSNDELALCDVISTISMASSFPSLNLSQAVMLYAYVLSGIEITKDINEKTTPGSISLRLLKEKIDILLSDTTLSSNKVLKGRIMERLSLASGNDIRLIHSITNSLMSKYGKEQK